MKVDRPPSTNINFRACMPGETFQRVSPYLSRLGITRVAAQTGLDCVGVPVWCAYTPNARSIVIAQGKGISEEAARTSAVMEAVERAVAGMPGCARSTTTAAALRADGKAVDTLPSLLAIKGTPVGPDETIEWVRGRDLTTSAEIFLPFEAVQFDRTMMAPRFWLSSDGLASGNTPTEAMLHGLLERVERDALTLWQIASVPGRYGRRIRVENTDNPELVEILRRIEAAGLELTLFDITTDLQVPAVAAYLGPNNRKSGLPVRHVDITLGAGAALSPEIAAIRAATEAVQSRMTFIGGARDDLVPQTFLAPALPQTLAAFDAPYRRTLADLPALTATRADEALAMLIGHLQAHKISKLYAVDLTPDWLPVSVIKVLAPELENPDGDRRQRFGSRALSRMLQ